MMRKLNIEISKKVAAGIFVLVAGLSTSFYHTKKPEYAGDLSNREPGLQLMNNRFLTFNTVVRVRQIEVSRDVAFGPDESAIHSPNEARAFREAVEKGWPGARITWAF